LQYWWSANCEEIFDIFIQKIINFLFKVKAKNFDSVNAHPFSHLIGVLAQYNNKVQQLLLKELFLEECLKNIGDESKSIV
jgi:hypothetical protein